MSKNPFEIPASPKTVKIRYLKEICPGISRKKKGDSFNYYSPSGQRITDTDELNRIKSLVLPPAWQDVWISPYSNSHLQATGIDAKGRKQYRYHPEWNKNRSETKFGKLTAFAKTLPRLREDIEKHLKETVITKDKVIALVLGLMSKSYIRIGNEGYAKEYGSYGLTTLLDKHVKVNGDSIRFIFKGKKGVMQDIELHDRRLARMVKSCRDIPGHELFQYYDEEGHRHVIESGDINGYLHETCGDGFSAKDFRTWAGTLHAFKLLYGLPVPQSEHEYKQVTLETIKSVSHLLGNTPAVCRKYYIHPILLESYKNGDLLKFGELSSKTAGPKENIEEQMLLDFLEGAH